MGRIVAIDYGGKRVGIAVTDPDQIIATGLTTVHSRDAMNYLKEYVAAGEVEGFAVGDPKNLNNTPSQSAEMVHNFVKHLKRTFPDKPVTLIDERFTSKIASQSMIMSGMKKKDRQQKGVVDMISATLILQTYLQMQSR